MISLKFFNIYLFKNSLSLTFYMLQTYPVLLSFLHNHYLWSKHILRFLYIFVSILN